MDNELPKAELGETGISVSRLGFGTALWRPERVYWTEDTAHGVFNAALDAGIDFIDTAFDYAFAEQWIGSGLVERYGEFALATKCGCTNTRPEQNNSDHLWTKENFHYNIDVSLERLQRESVDILQPHNPTVTEFEDGDLGRALAEIRDSGKASHIGISTTLPHLPVFLEMGLFATMQIPYSALEREHEDWITKVAESGVGTIIRGGIAQGEGGTRYGASKWEQFERAGLDDLRQGGESRSAFILRFTLSHPHIHTIIVGTSRPGHLAENIDAVRSGPLPPEVYAEAKARLDAIGQSPSPVG